MAASTGHIELERTIDSIVVGSRHRVELGDIAAVPLDAKSVDVAVFCLALMGSNFADFLREACRLLIPRSHLHLETALRRQQR